MTVLILLLFLNKHLSYGRDFPGGPVLRIHPPIQGTRPSIPGWGTKIPHAAGQLSPRATTREKPARGNEEPCNKRSCVPPARGSQK